MEKNLNLVCFKIKLSHPQLCLAKDSKIKMDYAYIKYKALPIEMHPWGKDYISVTVINLLVESSESFKASSSWAKERLRISKVYFIDTLKIALLIVLRTFSPSTLTQCPK